MMKRTTPLRRTGFKRKGMEVIKPLRRSAEGKLEASSFPLPKLPPIPRKRPKTTAVRKSAKGKPCFIRLPGCDGGGETTVLCHYRLAGYCGTGMKPSDRMASLGCWHCHEVVDGRKPAPEGYTRNDVLLAFAEGVMRSQEFFGREMKL